MLLSAVSVLVVAQSSSEFPEGLMNNPVISVFRRDILPPSSVQSISRKRKLNHYFVAWAETLTFFCTLPDSTAGWVIDVACYLSVRLQTSF